MFRYALIMFMLVGSVVQANPLALETPNYQVSISSQCEEGEVSCSLYTYTGVSKKSGQSIKLPGRSWHRMCKDGVTPCRFLGYQFNNADVTYRVYESGLLEVVQGEKVLLREQGEWR